MKKVFSIKTVVLSGIFLLFFFAGSTSKVFADYNNYLTLFKGLGTNTTPSFSVLRILRPSLAANPQPIFDFRFNFQAGFTTTADHDAAWHWDRVYDDQTNSFIVRICDIDATTETPIASTCIYSPIPSATEADGADLKVDGQPICVSVPDPLGGVAKTKCTLPAPADAWTKIYSKVALVSSESGSEFLVGGDPRTSFNVTFGTNAFKNLSDGAVVDVTNKFKIGNPTSYKADIWYCGAGGSGEFELTPAITATYDKNQVNDFNKLCSNQRVYFKIAESAKFQMPATVQDALNQTTTITPTTGGSTANTNVSQEAGDGLPSCSFTNGLLGSGSIMGCVAQIIYYVIYWPISWFAGLMGTIFDFFLGYSLSDVSYRADFAIKGWQLVRDISNIFFIIILVWTGLSTVFSTGSNMKRVVPQLILNALLINFSLFGTRVIIDLSNVVARVFYNSVHVCTGECKKDTTGTITNILTGPGGYKSLSTKIVSSFKPQTIFNAQTLASDAQAGGAQSTKSSGSEGDKAGYFIIVTLIAAAIMFGIAMMFWNVGFMFLGRVIGLYVAMIFAPFAVLTRGNMPLVGGIKELGWDSWWKDLSNYAMLAPIFVFFLYIIYSFLDSGFLKIITTDTNKGFFTTVISIAIPMLIIYFMMKQGVGIAKSLAGKIGNGIQDFVNKTVGGVGGLIGGGVGLAVGGAALLGRGAAAVVGQGTKALGFDAWAARNAEGTGVIGTAARVANRGLNKMQSGSWDIRNAGVKIAGKEYTAGGTFGKGLGLLGAKPDYKLADGVGLGQKAFLGGNTKIRKERDKKRAEEIRKDINYDHLSDEEAKKLWEDKKNKTAEKEAEKHWNNSVDIEDISKNSQAYKDLKKKESDLQLALSTATSAAAKATYEQALKQNKSAQDTALQQSKDQVKTIKETDEAAFQKLKLQTIEDLKKDKTYTESDAYKNAGIEGRKILDGYGDIKDAKSLTSAMRAEYARNLRENSFWMKDGKPRFGMSEGSAGITAGLAGFGAFLDLGLGAIVGGHVAELQKSFERASKTVMDEHKKTVGKGSDIGKMEEKLKHYDDKIKELVEKHKGVKNIDIDIVDNANDIEDALIMEIAEKNKEITTLDKLGDQRTPLQEVALARARAEVNKYKNLQEDRDKMKEKITTAKEKKKEKEDKDNKPKDDKPKDDKDKK